MKEFIEIPATNQSIMQRKPVYGVGVNDACYIVQPRINGKQVCCHYYKSWKGMLERCYSHKYQIKKPTYIGCSVSDDWLIFSSFKKWMINQNWDGMTLDKDIISIQNKVYSSENCLFVSKAMNSLFNEQLSSRGSCPQGVYFDKIVKSYASQCCIKGKQIRIGFFNDIGDAEISYLKFKSDLVIRTSNESESLANPRLRLALIRRAKIMTDRIDAIKNKVK